MVDAIPYTWPYDGELKPHATGVLLVGPQSAFRWMDAAGRVEKLCRDLLDAARGNGLPVFVVRYGRTEATPTRMSLIPVAGGPGWAFLDGLGPSSGETIVDAPTFDGFYGTSLHGSLWRRGIRYLVLFGFGTETGVHSTLRSANDRGYECLLLEDACAPVDPALQPAAARMVVMSGGIFGAMASAAVFMKSLHEGGTSHGPGED